jgi:hypothetical protein
MPEVENAVQAVVEEKISAFNSAGKAIIVVVKMLTIGAAVQDIFMSHSPEFMPFNDKLMIRYF